MINVKTGMIKNIIKTIWFLKQIQFNFLIFRGKNAAGMGNRRIYELYNKETQRIEN